MVIEVISIGDFKKLLAEFDDDLALDFGGFQFQELKFDGFNSVEVVLKEMRDHLPPESNIRNKP